MTSGAINGTNLRLYVEGIPVAYATSASLSLSRELRETIHKDNPGNGWAESLPGQKSGTCTIEALYNEDGAPGDSDPPTASGKTPYELFGYYNNGTALTCVMETTTAGDTVYTFSARITSLEINSPVEENATFSATLTITGEVTAAPLT